MATFKELLRLSFTSDDTEEWLDVHFTRPVGLAFALLWNRFGIHPNVITILSMFLGVGAGFMFYFDDLCHNICGVVLMMFANFCDSTDGQMARLTGKKTLIGRILDGFSEGVWFLAVYLAIVFRLWNRSMPGTDIQWGIWIFVLCAVAGFIFHSNQCSLSDYYRQIHLFFLKGKEGSELDHYEQQRRVYERILERSRREVTGSVKSVGFEKSRMIILTVLLRLRQVCCHLGLVDESGASDALPSGKLDHLNQILEEAMSEGHRVLVFSQFVKMLQLLRRELAGRGIPFCYLDGASKDRMEQVQRFNRDSSIPVFLISLKAGGAGLNLTGADEVVHFDPWWNPSVEDQATDRAHRIGQKRTVYVVKMIAEGTVEERVLALQQKKQLVIDATVGTTDAQAIQKLTYDDVKAIVGL